MSAKLELDTYRLSIRFEMDRMIATFSRFGVRAYPVGQDCAELDPDPDPDFDSDSDEIKPDIQRRTI